LCHNYLTQKHTNKEPLDVHNLRTWTKAILFNDKDLELAIKQDAITNASGQIDTHENTISTLEKELAFHKESIIELESNNNNEKSAADTADELERNIEKLQSQLDHTNTENECLQEDVAELQEEATELEKTLKSTENQNKRELQHLETLHKDKVDQLSETIDRTEQANQQKRKHLKQLYDVELSSLTTQLQQNKDLHATQLQQEKDLNKTIIESKVSIIERLKGNVDSNQNDAAELADANEKLTHYEAQLEQKDKETSRLGDQLQEAEADFDTKLTQAQEEAAKKTMALKADFDSKLTHAQEEAHQKITALEEKLAKQKGQLLSATQAESDIELLKTQA